MGKVIFRKNKHMLQEVQDIPKEAKILSEGEVFEAIDSFKNTKLYEDVNAYITKMKYSKSVTPYVDLVNTPESTTKEIIEAIDEDNNKPLIKRRFFVADCNGNNYIVNVQKLLMYYILCGMYIREIAPTLTNNIINKFNVKYTFELPTMATNGPDIIINPGFLCYVHQKDGMVGVVGIIVHEGFHVLMNHFQRRERRLEEFQDFERCNIAMDHEINLLINQNYSGIKFEKTIKSIGGMFNPAFDGMMWENIYPKISKNDPQGTGENQEDNPQDNQEGQGQKQGQQSSSSSSQGSPQGSSQGSGSNSNMDVEEMSPDFIEGWNAAMEDYKEELINI